MNSIKQLRFVRLSKTNYVGNQTMTFKNSNENVIYEAVTDTNDDSFYLVTLDQIYDIVGEEDWIHGESDCLVNLASGQMITLSWGAKKKERKEQRRVLSDEGLQVGNHVFVENHGNQWPHKAQIVDIDMEINFALIKWESVGKESTCPSSLVPVIQRECRSNRCIQRWFGRPQNIQLQ
jgi:hypothetical protein